MPLQEFKKEDILHNRVKTYPEINFFILSSSINYNYFGTSSVSFTDSTLSVYPFITKDSDYSGFRTVDDGEYDAFSYGDMLTSSYQGSTISSHFITSSADPLLRGLRNSLNSYSVLSRHYMYSSSFGNKESQEMRMIQIPSIFIGSSIQKGSVVLNFYTSGSLSGQLVDLNYNGELIETTGSATGSVAGVVLYDHGLILLTGSWNITEDWEDHYRGSGNLDKPAWKYFGVIEDYLTGSSFNVGCNGMNYINSMTMFCHAKKGELNNSNNPTFIKYGEELTITSGSKIYKETEDTKIMDISSPLQGDRTTYISSIGIYDENKQLIGVAKVSSPIKKESDRQITFKLTLDV